MRFRGILIGAGILGLLLLFLLFYLVYKFSNRHKLAGQLRYYEEGSTGSYSSVYSIEKLHRSKVAIGPRAGADLKIKDLGVPQAIKFKSKKIGDDFYLKPIGKSRAMLHFLDQKRKGLVSSGDKFKLGHYIFEYRHGQENK